jgi:hypothetical protein
MMDERRQWKSKDGRDDKNGYKNVEVHVDL